MKTVLQILLILALVALGVIQILHAKGVFAKPELIKVCPVNAIQMQNGKAVIDPDLCIGCRRCVIGVPGAMIPAPAPLKTVLPDTVSVSTLEAPKPAVPSSEATEKTVPILKKEPRKLQYTVNPAACIGCTLCVQNCPVNAITMVDGKAIIDNSKCIQCDVCVSGNKADFAGCPVQAITKR